MFVKGIIDEDFVNYRKPSMTIEFPYCTFKCGEANCQNSALNSAPNIEIEIKSIIDRYIKNPISESIVFQGLEPFDSIDIFKLINKFRLVSSDDIVIYTGYTEDELTENGDIEELKKYSNIIIKFGRYIPGQESHYDEVLGVNLASDNQYARKIE